MAKVENIEEVIAEYKREYRRVTGKTCPNVEVKRAWINVGNVSFRPEGFVTALEMLKKRPAIDKHSDDVKVNEDFATLAKAKADLVSIMNKLRSLNTVDAEFVENATDFIAKSVDEINILIEKNVMFE